MPPFIPKKRLNSSPPPSAKPSSVKKAKLADGVRTTPRTVPSLAKTKTFSLGSDDSDSSLSDVGSEQFEEVKSAATKPPAVVDPEGDEDEDIEWEDAGRQEPTPIQTQQPWSGGDLELTFRKDDDGPDYQTATAATASKKGPTKREKQARIHTHQLHVQFLLWHNAVRNRWICDKLVQQILIQQLPAQIKKEVGKWRTASGLLDPDEEPEFTNGQNKKKGKQKTFYAHKQRDWGQPSKRAAIGKADLSHGDPLISLLKILSAYWKKRFAITAPGLRKRGYGTKQHLKQDIASYRNEEHDPEKHGERIRNIAEFRELAKKCEGSRDVGAQLFTALLRGLGIESRLVASLQPSGYGWTKAEQMLPRKPAKPARKDESSDNSDSSDEPPASIDQITRKKPAAKTSPRKGNKDKPIDLDSDGEDSDGSEVPDDQSVVDITPSMPKQRAAKYDRDAPFPIYWTEAISPITSKTLPVSPLVIATPVASNIEVLASFEPRGAQAEKAKLVMAYVVAYASDGTAKDVTVRYLKKRIWPGKTKGFRFPVEKVPVYDKRGKVKRYEDYDWFKHLMSGYVRTDALLTFADGIEDSTDLMPQEPEKKDNKAEGDTLQSLRASADFVLERFLRREEALRPGAQPARKFTSGKGDKYKEENVYKRSDVERCLTAESWHKEGRKPKAGENPMKLVPVRAVTLTRKREAEEHQRMTGEKQMQGLYSWDQTEYIIPPPIKDGIIPKNAYGNIDCFVPSMIPRGAVHIPLRGTVRICKKLEIDFAEAVTGFEFGNKRAVPVCTGVVVAKEHEKNVKDAWKAWNEEQRRKEETKMEKLVLDLWRKFIMGLRIRERVEEQYGDDVAGPEVADLTRGMTKEEPIDVDDDETGNSVAPLPADDDEMAGGFLLPHEDDIPEQEDLVMESYEPDSKHIGRMGKEMVAVEYPTPVSLSSKPAPKIPKMSRLRHVQSESEQSQDSSTSGEDMESELSEEDETPNHSASRRPPAKKAKSIVEVRIPKRKASKQIVNLSLNGSSTPGSSSDVDSTSESDSLSDGGTIEDLHPSLSERDTGSSSSDSSASSEAEDEEDTYTPQKRKATSTLKSKPKPNPTTLRAQPTRKKQPPRSSPQPLTATKPKPRKETFSSPPPPTSSSSSSSRRLRRKSTRTSPYFQSG